jgi:mediator of RNA polymerase II transcription subunit 22
MKLLLLLSDEAQIVNRRDAELESIRTETAETKAKVATLLDELLGKRDTK